MKLVTCISYETVEELGNVLLDTRKVKVCNPISGENSKEFYITSVKHEGDISFIIDEEPLKVGRNYELIRYNVLDIILSTIGLTYKEEIPL